MDSVSVGARAQSTSAHKEELAIAAVVDSESVPRRFFRGDT